MNTGLIKISSPLNIQSEQDNLSNDARNGLIKEYTSNERQS